MSRLVIIKTNENPITTLSLSSYILLLKRKGVSHVADIIILCNSFYKFYIKVVLNTRSISVTGIFVNRCAVVLARTDCIRAGRRKLRH